MSKEEKITKYSYDLICPWCNKDCGIFVDKHFHGNSRQCLFCGNLFEVVIDAVLIYGTKRYVEKAG